MRISDWSSDVCSSDLNAGPGRTDAYATGRRGLPAETLAYVRQIAPELGASDGPSSVPAPALAAPGWRDASLFAARPQVTDTAETRTVAAPTLRNEAAPPPVRTMQIGRASCRERVCQYV